LILGRRKINVKELMQVIEMEAQWKMSTWCIEWIESQWITTKANNFQRNNIVATLRSNLVHNIANVVGQTSRG
jgi:activator of 2-hydroxyglutaryl-CoA dehydratase